MKVVLALRMKVVLAFKIPFNIAARFYKTISYHLEMSQVKLIYFFDINIFYFFIIFNLRPIVSIYCEIKLQICRRVNNSDYSYDT